jgi:hypothetical protein
MFSKDLKQTIYHSYSFCVFLHCSFPSETDRTFVASSLCMTQLNLVKEWPKYWKVFNDRYMFGDGQFYSIVNYKWVPGRSLPMLCIGEYNGKSVSLSQVATNITGVMSIQSVKFCYLTFGEPMNHEILCGSFYWINWAMVHF